ncbi:UvrD-helicase domain-containing protein [Campylobacter sp. US33a]|uniref:DNA 3'-5' helicase n=1 Tax=Campylobacter sp. CCS1377 TaxID=3158229 RepID=A0AAU7E7W7_9BACT|nr:UvrD-helicase domain-containing protein [Campylobacter sp. US33a]MCW1359740.1 UvrD-helicase domain-containing protein [Campylobacter jejuni]TEY04569.1 ATP-dependent helicase [Campylobacter sp. US33a]
MKLFENLNPSQEEAVKHVDGAMLILAGAGSGKTKTITTRLAYLIDEVGIAPSNTLTLTFTNKAANVMRNRALNMMKNTHEQNPLLCTFHKFGLLFLRLHIEKLQRKNNFLIIDTEDKKKILKDLINDDKSNFSNISAQISHFKNHSKSVEDVFEDLDFFQKDKEKFAKLEKIAKIYQNYQNYLLQNNFVDFDDLLWLTNTILESDQNFAKEQSELYNYITVDEYQDTNTLQYKILKNLCNAHENIVVVGDDDQSIYGWRGAKIENILNFQNEFNNVKLVKLEQNYRSVNTILQAANNLIEHNRKRLGKKLICTKDKGEEVKILENEDEKSESFKIAKLIKELLKNKIKANEIAILFRVNALSRALEEALMKEKIPFKLLSGVRFYERAEIKDIISYLRLLANLDDDYSFKRIINRPKRGFGDSSFEKLQKYAQSQKISLFEGLCNTYGTSMYSTKCNNELELFIENIKAIKECQDLGQIITQIEQRFKIKEFYKEMSDGEERILNIDEFYANFKDQIKEGKYESLDDILNEISLLSDQDELEGESVYIMSVHASKGLEFDHVFIIGLEEGFFPLNSETSDIEEERRLAYVAITRAKKSLHLSYANSRFYKGSRSKLAKSRFLGETGLIEAKLIIEQDQKNFRKGDLIKHKIFGIGRIINVSKVGNEEKLGINFGGIERTIMSSFVEKIV